MSFAPESSQPAASEHERVPGAGQAAATPPTIRVSAVVLRDELGRVLNVRKRGTNALMLPGGKHEPGEDPRDTAVRECWEELGLELDREALRPLGVFRTAAANEPGHLVEATVFAHPLVPGASAAAPQAEIAQLEWVDPALARDDLAPLNTELVFPALLAADSAETRAS
ncbi:NUDIX hydrolase [Leucobacter chromiireducens]|uniref:NUDIX hydrolase n=1 Tax=Leucobacter chromiireducens TaxID=283877 RepID=UPI0013DE2EB2|nr:NUDIX domain-containing protein [Leucobacter chromiireducens]